MTAPTGTATEFVDCRKLGPGTLVDVETRNRHYLIECLGGNSIRISGHPEYCPTPVQGQLTGLFDRKGLLEPGLIGLDRHLKFAIDEARAVTTSTVLKIRVQNTIQ